MDIKKIIIPFIIAIIFCGCAKTMPQNTTISNISTTENSTTITETPTARAVVDLNSLSTKKVVWGPGNIENHQQPADPKALQQQYSSFGGNWLLDDKKSVCLTFDEGYENGYTPAILDTLKEKGVSAVFFVTYDFAKDNPTLVERMIKEGHIVGNHTYRHYTMDEVSSEVAKEEIMFLHDYIKKEHNYTMSYFRFPKGEFSERVLAQANDLGYKSIFWSFAYADWDTNNQIDQTKAFTNICESTHDGEIILLHAVSQTNANILGNVIDDIRKQGYTFTTKI